MYVVYNRNTGKRIMKNNFFWSYDEARAAVRSHIRALVRKGKATKMGLWDNISRNPSRVSLYGFDIKRAA